ncbi:ParB N-terminal domain-containing protein [Rhodopirellula sp. JC639]|uniref:ParB N-terminal domain-containing protein n=1 Tax=Stieleria mannarensis TaxID=2755585 RepID=UPI001602C82C|nr:ParB N-terminal domain-containing protein [Rhodopirellula sp. JC639]
MMKTQVVQIDQINRKASRTRGHIRLDVADEYADLYEKGVDLPPPVVFYDGHFYFLAAGDHRIEAALRLGLSAIECQVKTGGRWEAIEFGLKDNANQLGERLSADDRRHNTHLVLRERPEFSNSAIAKMCGVSDKTVAKWRDGLESTSEIPKLQKRTGRDGKSRKMATPIDERVAAGLFPDSDVDSRRFDCETWWDLFAGSTFFLREISWSPPAIAKFLGMDLTSDVLPLLCATPRQREIAEFQALSPTPGELQLVYDTLQCRILNSVIANVHCSAAGHADRLNLPKVALRLKSRSRVYSERAHFGPAWEESVAQSDCFAESRETDNVDIRSAVETLDEESEMLLDFAAYWDVRISLGIEKCQESIAQVTGTLASIRESDLYASWCVSV